MRIDDFDFELPAERIAQHPLDKRDASRLLVLDRRTGAVQHRRFHDLPRLLDPGDLVVLNDTKVIPARLAGRKESGGKVELFLLEPAGPRDDVWRCLMRSSRKPRPGTRLLLDHGGAVNLLSRDGEEWTVQLSVEGETVEAFLARAGEVPLPPYIRRPHGTDAEDRERYQTVFAREPGAVAAPTAGLHFTPGLLERLEARGVDVAHLTLHVGPGTFRPLRVERVEEHVMHEERFVLPDETASAWRRVRGRGGRVVAVGTTVVRTLESCMDPGGHLNAGGGTSDLFIYPGFTFRAVDTLVTNFHLPRSSLLLLVSAFAGRDRLLAAYREAVETGYRFYSYGDAMLVV